MAKKMKVTKNLSDVHDYSNRGLKLWLTPGSGNPYWASNASFMHDSVVATPWDFLEEAGYDTFDDEPDYENCDESITIKIKLIPNLE